MVIANPVSDYMGKYPRIEDMIRRINKLNKNEISRMKDVESIPLPARQSLIVFLKDWTIDDPNHERYMNLVPEGFPKEEALRMGDLLSFCLTPGSEERKKTARPDKFVPWTRWMDYLQPFEKNKPEGTKLHQLIGLHVELLNMLPQRSYNQYTVSQMFYEDQQMINTLLGERVKLSPLQFEALTMLSRIVETGAIEQFKLAITRGSKKSLVQLSQYLQKDIGQIVMDAFMIAQQATIHFAQGDFAKALKELEKLQDNYGIGTKCYTSLLTSSLTSLTLLI